jgi:hypothetical protein
MIWLENFFEIAGDVAPNKDEVMLAIGSKKEVYDKFEREFLGCNKVALKYETFIEIWNAIYPFYVKRPWCSIPGKCETCFDCDKGRREASSDIENKMWSEAHLLHRGGMFMVERSE